MAAPIRQLPLPFVHAPVYAGVDFLSAASNEEALAWLDLTADWPARRLALWGDEGSGKTHLLHRWAERTGATLLCPATLRATRQPTRPVALDNAEFAPERRLLHLLNAAAEAALPVLIAGRAPPARWPTGLPDLASRLRATVAIRILPPDDALLAALLRRLVADRQLLLPENLQAVLLERLPRDPAAYREAVARLDHLAYAAGGRVTRAITVAVVAELAAVEQDVVERGARADAAQEKDDDFGSAPHAPSRPQAGLF